MDDKVQPDGLPTAEALAAFDDGLALIKQGLDRINNGTTWTSFGLVSPGDGYASLLGEQWITMDDARRRLQKIRCPFSVETVTSTKVVRNAAY